MSPKIVDRHEKRKEIGLVALDHFAQKGFAASSISQVAKAAGVGKGTIYEYFQSKDDLISFTLELYVEKIEESVSSMLVGIPNPKERIRHYIFEVIETFMNDPRTMGLLVAIFQMLIADKEGSGKTNLLRGMFQRARQTIATFITEGVSKGMFRPEARQEAETIAINMIAYLDGIWLHSLISAEGIDLYAQVDYYLDNLFRSIDITPITEKQEQQKNG
jgi:AcrR family transcriptional regulator